MVKYVCCAPGCAWKQSYEVEPPDQNPGGYTSLAACPSCKTPDSIHYGCEFENCDKRAVRIKGWGRSCREHFGDLRRAVRGR